jgi:putative transposase
VDWFLRSQADALLACAFLETVTLAGAHMFVLALIEHRTRRIRVLGATAHPCESWVVQATRNLVRDLQDARCRARFLIRDRDGKFPGLFDAVLADAGIKIVLTGVRMPRMNAIMERWIQTCRHELLDRTLIWNQHHLLRALREFEEFYNEHRPHQGIANARPLCPLRRRSLIRSRSPAWTYEDTNVWAEYSTSTSMPPELHGGGFRQPQGYLGGHMVQTAGH